VPQAPGTKTAFFFWYPDWYPDLVTTGGSGTPTHGGLYGSTNPLVAPYNKG